MSLIRAIQIFSTKNLTSSEHSIANMYFLPAGMIAQNFIEGAKNISWGEIFIKNLIPVTMGNIIGGCFLVGFLYWMVTGEEK